MTRRPSLGAWCRWHRTRPWSNGWAPPRPRVDSALVKALARAFRWRKLIENGVYAGGDEIARAERINRSYVSRVLRLTLLAPDIVAAVVEGRHGPEITLDALMAPLALSWQQQKLVLSQ